MGLFLHSLTSRELTCYGFNSLPLAADKFENVDGRRMETRIDRADFIVYNNVQVIAVATNRNGCRNAADSATLCSKYPNYIIYIIN